MDNTPQDRIGQRLDELEIKASYTEDLFDQLNLTIFRQQQQIDRLTQQVAQLKEQANRAGPGGDSAVQDPRDELPPHY